MPLNGPAFQCYAKDLYTGTSDLSPAEFGTYWRGICWSWDNGPLPPDDARRARVLLLAPDEFRALWPGIAGLWECTEVGWICPRLEQVRRESDAYKAQKRRAGRASASSRKRNHLRTDGQRTVNGTSTDTPTEGQRKGNPPISDLHTPYSDLQDQDQDTQSARPVRARRPDQPDPPRLATRRPEPPQRADQPRQRLGQPPTRRPRLVFPRPPRWPLRRPSHARRIHGPGPENRRPTPHLV